MLKSILKLNEINSTQIANHLEPHQLYIDFARGNDNYYLFTIDNRNNISFQQIDENHTKMIDINVKAYRDITEDMADEINKNDERKIFDGYVETSKKEAKIILSKLYNLLIKEYLEEIIKEKKELIISPDGLLNYFPFEALYSGSYLIEEYTINYIASGKEFVRQTKLTTKNPKYEMILFANANFNATLKGGMFGNTNSQKKKEKIFPNLEDIEITMINDHYANPIIFKEENATIKNLMKVESSRILHLSTHGIVLKDINILNPMRKSVLVFAGGNNNLEKASISALKLSTLDLKDTELVVLSACQSGLGDIQSAEGVVGLPKALLQAGAKNVLMSLWTVSNKKTATLMGYFYDNILNEQHYNQALKNAKIKMIKSHPYYWSSFILSGL
jgi:CHAT domain-containing protein